MPPPHLTILSARDEDGVEEPGLWRTRMAFGPPKPRDQPPETARIKPRRPGREPAARVLATPRLHVPVPGPSRLPPVAPMPVYVPPPPPEPELMAEPPALVAEIVAEPMSVNPPAPAEKPEPVPSGAVERAYMMGRSGARPKHAMSAAELSAWQDGAMDAGRGRDPIFGRPQTWWWLLLAAVLMMPMAYAVSWIGAPGSPEDFLMTRVGQEAWIAFGPSAGMFYWVALFIFSLVFQLARPMEPLLIVYAATWWGWTGLYMLSAAGWLAQHIPPPPIPG